MNGYCTHNISTLKFRSRIRDRRLLQQVKAQGPPKISRAYYKLQEIFRRYPTLVSSSKVFVCASAAEGPGGFMQAIVDERLRKVGDVSKDRVVGITLQEATDSLRLVGKRGREFLKKYMGKPIEVSTGGSDGNLLRGDVIKNFSKSDGSKIQSKIKKSGLLNELQQLVQSFSQ